MEAGTSSGDGVLYPKSCEAWYFDYDQNDWAQLTDMTNENGEKVSTVGVLGEEHRVITGCGTECSSIPL